MPEPAATPAAPISTGVVAPEAPEAGALPAAGGSGTELVPGAAPGTPAEPTPTLELTEKEKAFLAAVQDERGKRQATETELAQLKQMFEVVSRNSGQPQPAPAPSQEDPITSMDDDDIVTGKQFKSIMFGLINQFSGALTGLQRSQQFGGDMDEAIRVHLPKVIQEDPQLGQVLKSISGPAQLVIAHALGRLAKKAAGPSTPTPPTPPEAPGGPDDMLKMAMQILNNSAKPAPAGAGGGANITDLATQLKGMSPEAFSAYYATWKKSVGL